MLQDTLTLTDNQKAKIQSYKRLGIDISIEDDDKVIITQSRLVNGAMLTQKELYDRAKEIFPDRKYKFVTNVYSLDLNSINIEWIENKMNEYGIRRGDLIKQLGIDKSTLSLIFTKDSEKRKISLTRAMKAAFYYYFQTFKLSTDIRDILNNEH